MNIYAKVLKIFASRILLCILTIEDIKDSPYSENGQLKGKH